MLEDLLEAGAGDIILVQIPFVAGNVYGIFEKYQQFCEKQELVYSEDGMCCYESKNKDVGKGPTTWQSFAYSSYNQEESLWTQNTSGGIDCAKVLQLNHNPSLHVLFYKENTFHTTTLRSVVCRHEKVS